MGENIKNSISNILSASKIKTFEDCSWIFWSKYHLHLPDTANEGSARGTICHLIFELLLKSRHRKHYDQITKDKSFDNSPVIRKLVEKHLKSYDFETQENYDLIEKMVVVGLNNDFFEEDGELGEAETSFLIENKKLKYKVRGFIDKHAFHDNTLVIIDYKSSKKKFKGEGLTANVQAMMYTLAGRKLKKNIKKIKVRFLFLRFPRAPVQEVEFSKDEMDGFEIYLSYLSKIIKDFDETDATSNYAADKPDTKWFCSAGKTWVCPLKEPFAYYALVDGENNVIKTSKEDNLELQDGCVVKKMKYLGCPRYYYNKPSEVTIEHDGIDDLLDKEPKASHKNDPFNFS